jgi:hypothetical protein
LGQIFLAIIVLVALAEFGDVLTVDRVFPHGLSPFQASIGQRNRAPAFAWTYPVPSGR